MDQFYQWRKIISCRYAIECYRTKKIKCEWLMRFCIDDLPVVYRLSWKRIAVSISPLVWIAWSENRPVLPWKECKCDFHEILIANSMHKTLYSWFICLYLSCFAYFMAYNLSFNEHYGSFMLVVYLFIFKLFLYILWRIVKFQWALWFIHALLNCNRSIFLTI